MNSQSVDGTLWVGAPRSCCCVRCRRLSELAETAAANSAAATTLQVKLRALRRYAVRRRTQRYSVSCVYAMNDCVGADWLDLELNHLRRRNICTRVHTRTRTTNNWSWRIKKQQAQLGLPPFCRLLRLASSQIIRIYLFRLTSYRPTFYRLLTSKTTLNLTATVPVIQDFLDTAHVINY